MRDRDCPRLYRREEFEGYCWTERFGGLRVPSLLVIDTAKVIRELPASAGARVDARLSVSSASRSHEQGRAPGL